MNRETRATIIMLAPCGYCGAKEGQRCRTFMSRWPWPGLLHKVRIHAAHRLANHPATQSFEEAFEEEEDDCG